MSFLQIKIPSARQTWPGYFLIAFGAMWGIWEIFVKMTPKSGLFFLIFLGIGLFCLRLAKKRLEQREWLWELGVFFLVGSLGYFGVTLGLLQKPGIKDFWGVALSTVLIRVFFKNPAYLLVYFFAVLIFLFSASHFMTTQFGLGRDLNGALFLFGFGLSFLYLYLISRPEKEYYWSLTAGILLTFLGLFLMSTWNPRPIVQIVSAFDLIFLGIWLIWPENKSGKQVG